MTAIEIKTNHHKIELLGYWELPEGILEREFDYIKTSDEEQDASYRFFKYRGNWYDIQEFTRIEINRGNNFPSFSTIVEPDSPLAKWQGIQSDSYFSGIVMKWYVEPGFNEPDFEHIVAGTYIS